MKAFVSKFLTQTDIDRRFSVPTEALNHFPFLEADHRRLVLDLKVKDSKGKLWSFRCKCRKGAYPKPVLSKGWLQFVHSKGLKVGDKVVFYKKKDEEETKGVVPYYYKIEVKRKILRLMGQDIWVDVENLHLYGV